MIQSLVTADTPEYFAFMGRLSMVVRLLESSAKGLLTLEGQNTNCADVFLIWVGIAWHLEKVLSNPQGGLTSLRSEVTEIYDKRFTIMMNDSSFNLNFLCYFFHPRKYQPIFNLPCPVSDSFSISLSGKRWHQIQDATSCKRRGSSQQRQPAGTLPHHTSWHSQDLPKRAAKNKWRWRWRNTDSHLAVG